MMTILGKAARSEYKLGFVSPTPLGRILQRALQARSASGRQVSLAAGLSQDTVRNLVQGKSANPQKSTLDAIAAVLNTTAADLLAEVERERDAEKLSMAAKETVAKMKAPQMTPVINLQAAPCTNYASEHPEMPARGLTRIPAFREGHTEPFWDVPRSFAATIQHPDDELAILLAPNSLRPIRKGDWLIVRRTKSVISGVVVYRVPQGLVVAHIAPLLNGRVRIAFGNKSEPDETFECREGEVDVVAQVVSHLAPM